MSLEINTMLSEGQIEPQQKVMGYMNNLSFEGQWLRREGKGDPHKSTRIKDYLERMLTVQGGDQGESTFLPDRQQNSSVLSVEGGQHPLQETERFCEENLAHIPQGQSNGLSRVAPWGSKFQSRCLVQM